MEVYAMIALVGFGYVFSKNSKAGVGSKAARGASGEPGDRELASHRAMNPDMTGTMVRNEELRKAQELERAPNFIGRQGGDNPFSAPDRSETIFSNLAGIEMSGDDFQHNNMQPFFGSHVKGITADNDTSGILENFAGTRGPGNDMKRIETQPLFRPEETAVEGVHGAPAFTQQAGVIGRYEDSLTGRRENERPFQPINVGPGLDRGYTADPSGGFHQGDTRDFVMPKNVDQLRRADNPRSEYAGRMLPGQGIPQRGVVGEMTKNRPETSFELDRHEHGGRGPDAPTQRPEVLGLTREGFAEDFRMQPAVAAGSGGQRMPWDPVFTPYEQKLPEGARDMMGASASRWAPQKPDDLRFAGNELSARQSTDRWESMIGPAGSTITRNAHLDGVEAARASGREATQDAGRVFGNMSVQIPSRPPAYDPSETTRTTLKETNVQDTRSGNVGSLVSVYGGGGGEEAVTRNTIRQDQHAFGETVRNVKNPYGSHVDRDMPDAPGATVRDTISQNRGTEGFVSVDRGAPGAYVSTDNRAGPTHREFTQQKTYPGSAYRGEPTGYVNSMDAMKGGDTGTAMTASGLRDSDFDYYGIPKSDEAKGLDYTQMYNATLNEAKEHILRSRLPGGHGAGSKQAPGASSVGRVHARAEPTQVSYTSAPKLPSQTLGHGGLKVREDSAADNRLDRSMLDWVSDNPYVSSPVWNSSTA